MQGTESWEWNAPRAVGQKGNQHSHWQDSNTVTLTGILLLPLCLLLPRTCSISSRVQAKPHVSGLGMLNFQFFVCTYLDHVHLVDVIERHLDEHEQPDPHPPRLLCQHPYIYLYHPSLKNLW